MPQAPGPWTVRPPPRRARPASASRRTDMTRSQKHAPSSPAASTPAPMCMLSRSSPQSAASREPSSSRRLRPAKGDCLSGCGPSVGSTGSGSRAPAPTGWRRPGIGGQSRSPSWRSCGPTVRSAGGTARRTSSTRSLPPGPRRPCSGGWRLTRLSAGQSAGWPRTPR